MISLLILIAVGGYLLTQGTLNETVWITLNVVDTLRALRTVRANGRRVGLATRTRAMRNSLVCWVVYMTCSSAGPVADWALGWAPFYGPIKLLVTLLFMASRLAASTFVYSIIVEPVFARYETPIDLTLLLVHSITVLATHFFIFVPLDLVTAAISTVRRRLNILPSFLTRRWAQTGVEVNGKEDKGGIDTDSLDVDAEHATTRSYRRAKRVGQATAPVSTPAPKPKIREPSPEPLGVPRTPRPSTPTRQSSNLLAPPVAPTTVRRSPRRAVRPQPSAPSAPSGSTSTSPSRGPSVNESQKGEDEIHLKVLQLPKAPTTISAVTLTSLPRAPRHDPSNPPGPPSAPGADTGGGPSRPSSRASDPLRPSGSAGPTARSVNVPKSKSVGSEQSGAKAVGTVGTERRIKSAPSRLTKRVELTGDSTSSEGPGAGMNRSMGARAGRGVGSTSATFTKGATASGTRGKSVAGSKVEVGIENEQGKASVPVSKTIAAAARGSVAQRSRVARQAARVGGSGDGEEETATTFTKRRRPAGTAATSTATISTTTATGTEAAARPKRARTAR